MTLTEAFAVKIRQDLPCNKYHFDMKAMDSH